MLAERAIAALTKRNGSHPGLPLARLARGVIREKAVNLTRPTTLNIQFKGVSRSAAPDRERISLTLLDANMNKILVSLGLVFSQMLAVGAYAQISKGEADASGAMAASSAKATKAEKAAAKAARKASTAQALKKGEIKNSIQNESKGARKAATPEEKAAAKVARKASAADAVKKGQIQSGEK